MYDCYAKKLVSGTCRSALYCNCWTMRSDLSTELTSAGTDKTKTSRSQRRTGWIKDLRQRGQERYDQQETSRRRNSFRSYGSGSFINLLQQQRKVTRGCDANRILCSHWNDKNPAESYTKQIQIQCGHRKGSYL